MATKGKLPFMKFYPADWRSDPGVRAATAGARGFWIECMSIMHEAWPYGHLLLSGKAPTERELAVQVAMTVCEVRRYRRELLDRQIASETDEGVLYSRRMVRDEERRRQNRDNGKLGGNPRLCGSDNRPDEPSDNSSDKAHARESRGQRLDDLPDADAPAETGSAETEDTQRNGDGDEVHAFLRAFCELYAEHRGGAKYLVQKKRDVALVKRLLKHYGRERLVKIAELLHRTDEPWVESSDRGIQVLSTKANWLESRLREHGL